MQNEVLETIGKRRTIRAFSEKQVPKENLDALLKAAVASPSGMNKQPWQFIAIQNKAVLDRLEKDIVKTYEALDDPAVVERIRSRGNKIFYDAPTLIIIAMEPGPYATFDTGIAAENIAIAAKSFGMDSAILAMPRVVFQSEKGEAWMKELQFPPGYEYGLAVAVGYAAIETDPHVPDMEKITYIS